jgi:hypothetical protein
MRKFFAAALIVTASFGAALAQQTPGASDDTPNMGIAPKAMNDIGRADVRVFDQDGNPIQNANLRLVSNRTDGYQCESWGSTNAKGVMVLLPIHMGDVTLEVKAKGYKKQSIHIPLESLGQPIHVTMVHK